MTKSEFFKILSGINAKNAIIFNSNNLVMAQWGNDDDQYQVVSRHKSIVKAHEMSEKYNSWMCEFLKEGEPTEQKITGDKLVNAVTQIVKVKKEKSLERQFIRAAKVFYKKNKISDSKHSAKNRPINRVSPRNFGLMCLGIILKQRAEDIAHKAYCKRYGADEPCLIDGDEYYFYTYFKYRKHWFYQLAREDILLWWHKNYAMENIIALACHEI